MKTLFRGAVVLSDRVVGAGAVLIESDRIVAAGPLEEIGTSSDWTVLDHPGYITPGFVDLHVHGGSGADFMDATGEAFQIALTAHTRHGTTSIVPTTTVASREVLLEVLRLGREHMRQPGPWARVLGIHFYGPYFGKQAAGCHPPSTLRDPDLAEYREYLEFADGIATATVAPELPGAEGFARACRNHGIVVNAGHSHCTFEQVRQAIGWGVTHVDHLFCAMSDRARLRTTQTYPMRGGLLEATLYFDELTTEVIADGKHLAPELLLLAHKIKGPDRLALVTDCNRALNMPDGIYDFGPQQGGEKIRRADDVGLMLDQTALASSVMGMDHMVRTFHRQTGVPLHEVVRMASLTPARIVGHHDDIGSLEAGKFADLLLLSKDLQVEQVWISGKRWNPKPVASSLSDTNAG